MGDRDTTEIKVCPQLDLYPPGGEILAAEKIRTSITFAGDQLVELRLIFQVSFADWQRIDAGGWFHLGEEDAKGPIFGGDFDPAKPIEIEATLRTQSLPLVAISSEDIWDIGALFLDATPGSELISTENWFALYVKQDALPGLKTGLQTKWAHD